MTNIIEVRKVKKSFGSHIVLSDISFTVEEGDFFIVTGKSGCGKSTLLNVIGLLDTIDSGEILLFNEKSPKPFSRKAEKLLRNKIGYLFQNFALIENESVAYNLSLIMDRRDKDKEAKIKEVLAKVKLEGFEKKKIYECSGGEQQRIALARLLLKPCEVILADEPTGSLDPLTKQEIVQLLVDLNKQGKTIIMVTHDPELMHYATHSYAF